MHNSLYLHGEKTFWEAKVQSTKLHVPATEIYVIFQIKKKGPKKYIQSTYPYHRQTIRTVCGQVTSRYANLG